MCALSGFRRPSEHLSSKLGTAVEKQAGWRPYFNKPMQAGIVLFRADGAERNRPIGFTGQEALYTRDIFEKVAIEFPAQVQK